MSELIDYNDEQRFSRATLELFQFHCNEMVDQFPLAVNNAELRSHLDPYLKRIVLKLHTWLLAKEHKQGTVREYRSWWDHFKDSKFPDWAKKKWPAKYYDHVIQTSYVCPHATEKWERNKQIHIDFMMQPAPSSKEK